MTDEKSSKFASADDAKAFLDAKKRTDKGRQQDPEIIELLEDSSSDEEVNVSYRKKKGFPPARPATASSTTVRGASFAKPSRISIGSSSQDPIDIDSDDDVTARKPAARSSMQQTSAASTSNSQIFRRSSTWQQAKKNLQKPLKSEKTLRQETIDGARRTKDKGQIQHPRTLFDGPRRQRMGRAASVLHGNISPGKSGPQFVPGASFESSRTENANQSRTSICGEAAMNFPRRRRRASTMGARATVQNSANGVVKLGRGGKRKSSLSGYRPDILEISDDEEELPLLPNQRRIALPSARSSSPSSSHSSPQSTKEPQEDSEPEIISILDDSDEEVPEEAFVPVCPSKAAIDPSRSPQQGKKANFLPEETLGDEVSADKMRVSRSQPDLAPENKSIEQEVLSVQSDEGLEYPDMSALDSDHSYVSSIDDDDWRDDENQIDQSSPLSASAQATMFVDDGTTSPDESMDVDTRFEEIRRPSFAQAMDLLQPSPMARLNEIQGLSKSSEEKSEWLKSVETLQGVNVIEEWYKMARNLREWQKENESSEDAVTTPIAKATVHHNKISSIPKEDANFHGGVDDPIETCQDVGSLGVMQNIPKLDKTYIDAETGLPVRLFSVVGSSCRLIYSFAIQAKESSIPNAGNGLFLKFLGAKELKPSKRKRQMEVEEFRHVVSDPYEELEAIHPAGFGINVDVTGEHIKTRHNTICPFQKLEAILFKTGNMITGEEKKMTVKFSDPDLPYDADELQGLRNPGERIDHYKLFYLDDYVDAPRRKFSSLHPESGFLDIGRYGPFLKEDRKLELHFQAKTFLFGSEPSMWGFGVEETIMGGRGQTVDITDDFTGEPHATAQANLPMYVNEVGHSKRLETIHACQENGRVIKYFFVIRKPMKKGDELELFVNYRDGYEENRERKGYGKKNLAGIEKSDDHLPSRLKRNFSERKHLLLDVKEAKMSDFTMLVNFCAKLAYPLHQKIDELIRCATIGKDFVRPLTTKQVIAVRRLDWLTSAFKARFETDSAQAYDRGPVDDLFSFQCKESLPDLEWNRWSELFTLLAHHKTLKDQKGNNLWDELYQEATEEICYGVSDIILLPLEECRWCPVAVELTQNLCLASAMAFWSPKRDQTRALYKKLAQQFLSLAKKAADEIVNNTDPDRLAFDCDFADVFVFEKQGSASRAARGEKIVVTKQIGLAFEGESNESAPPVLIACPSALVEKKDFAGSIHSIWYLARQVFFVVEAIAQFVFDGDEAYSRDQLLETIGLDSGIASIALDKDVLPRCTTRLKPPRKEKKERKSPTEQKIKKLHKKASAPHTAKKTEKANSALFWNVIWPVLKDENGWTLQHGNRSNDFYAIPRGVIRGGKGGRPRIDFFDSVPLVINCLKTDPTWSSNASVQRCMDEYYKCLNLYEKVKGTKAFPKFKDPKDKILWLRDQVKKQS